MKTAGITISPVQMDDRQKVDVRTGDTVRVWQKVQEKGKTRLQPFEGVVLARKHGNEAGATFTVRRVSGGFGVEKIFPLYSPIIDKIEIIKRAKVRRSKLYHIREKAAREIKRQMRNMRFVDISTKSDTEEKARIEKEAQEAEAKAAEEKVAAEAAQKAEDSNSENEQEEKTQATEGQDETVGEDAQQEKTETEKEAEAQEEKEE